MYSFASHPRCRQARPAQHRPPAVVSPYHSASSLLKVSTRAAVHQGSASPTPWPWRLGTPCLTARGSRTRPHGTPNQPVVCWKRRGTPHAGRETYPLLGRWHRRAARSTPVGYRPRPRHSATGIGTPHVPPHCRDLPPHPGGPGVGQRVPGTRRTAMGTDHRRSPGIVGCAGCRL
jgi:hypothetical protein